MAENYTAEENAAEKKLEERLALIPLLSGLSPESLKLFAREMRVDTVKEGERVFSQGDQGDTLYLIESGRVRVFGGVPGGEEVVLDILGPGDVLGELALLDGETRSASVEALSNCTLLALDRDTFWEHLRAHPETAIQMLTVLSQRLRQTVLQAEAVSANSSTERLAHVLLFLAEKDGKIEPGVLTTTLCIPDVAATIGTSEDWAEQMLGEWHRDGIIGLTGRRRLILHDVAALRALANIDYD